MTHSKRQPLLRLAVGPQAHLPLLIIATLLAGCSTSRPTTQPTSWSDQAHNDPMNYNPNMEDWPTVSGGGLSHFDQNAFNRDLNHVLNP